MYKAYLPSIVYRFILRGGLEPFPADWLPVYFRATRSDRQSVLQAVYPNNLPACPLEDGRKLEDVEKTHEDTWDLMLRGDGAPPCCSKAGVGNPGP